MTNLDLDHIKALVAEWRRAISPELSSRTPEAVGFDMANELEALLAAYVAGREALRDARASFDGVQALITALAGRPSIIVETAIEKIDAALATKED